MRMLMDVKLPVEKFNEAVRNGSVGDKMTRILEEIRPEASYFHEKDGHRGGTFIIDIPDPSRVPALAEPWFLLFDAEVSFHVVMSPEDLAKSGLEGIGKKWGGR